LFKLTRKDDKISIVSKRIESESQCVGSVQENANTGSALDLFLKESDLNELSPLSQRENNILCPISFNIQGKSNKANAKLKSSNVLENKSNDTIRIRAKCRNSTKHVINRFNKSNTKEYTPKNKKSNF
jgi:hypothetical protein